MPPPQGQTCHTCMRDHGCRYHVTFRNCRAIEIAKECPAAYLDRARISIDGDRG
nr:hypothetical protein [Rhizobium sp. CF122]